MCQNKAKKKVLMCQLKPNSLLVQSVSRSVKSMVKCPVLIIFAQNAKKNYVMEPLKLVPNVECGLILALFQPKTKRLKKR